MVKKEKSGWFPRAAEIFSVGTATAWVVPLGEIYELRIRRPDTAYATIYWEIYDTLELTTVEYGTSLSSLTALERARTAWRRVQATEDFRKSFKLEWVRTTLKPLSKLGHAACVLLTLEARLRGKRVASVEVWTNQIRWQSGKGLWSGASSVATAMSRAHQAVFQTVSKELP